MPGVFLKIYQTAALKAAPGLNFTDLDALILIFSPVWGLTPVRAERFEIEKVPQPINWTDLSFFTPFLTLSKTASTERTHTKILKLF